MHKTYKIRIRKKPGQPPGGVLVPGLNGSYQYTPQYCVEEKLNGCKVSGKITINMTVFEYFSFSKFVVTTLLRFI